ncbi:MAG TPA: ribosomal protein S18-alanine N-acetyltransferase [Anaeromyxobacter sp.]|nr:ribosomal protein S18-alanine N-acetyltransferase [Candidatus Sulfotelmatobacter sp.]HVI94309.1 ribosomal protein S18-alanine N-acetyltransferase [Anaeromyxobacter sp.]
MSGAGPVIEPMTLAELPEVLAIEQDSFATPWTAENFRHEIEGNPRAWNLVLRAGGRVVGYACCYLVADELQINEIAIARASRRAGHGGALLAHLIRGARLRGAARATLEVRPSNLAARALYAAHGFAETGRRPGYYADTGEPAILMERTL